MLDFYKINVENLKKNVYEIYPVFKVMGHPKDLMIKGRDFYAVWDEDTGLWSKDEDTVIRLIDQELYSKASEIKDKLGEGNKVKVRTMEDSRSGMIDFWHKYVQRQMRDTYKELDEKLTFANTETKKNDFVSRRLPYSLSEGSHDAWDELVGTLYSPEEREKIEWAIGAIVSGDSKKIQKFVVFYGEGGTGKSTIMNILEKLFEGYFNRFDSKELTSSNNSFALESFKNNPLVSIQHDGDLSRIEDNTKLNSIVSHESMEVNEKFKSKYVARFNTFIFMGTNKPVRITEARSGIIRRLIDVHPTGNKIPRKRYDKLMEQIEFELGYIAKHCLDVYQRLGKGYYDDYIPKDMISSTNDFYDFMETYYDRWLEADGTPLKVAWNLYLNEYCNYANVIHKLQLRSFRVELANYFREVKDSYTVGDERYRNYYLGFKWKKFPGHDGPVDDTLDESVEDGAYGIRQETDGNWIIFREASEIEGGSVFDAGYEGQLAQYAKRDGTPKLKWIDVTTKLMDLDTSRLHYILLPEHHIVIDFDLKNDSGEKDIVLNMAAASKFPKTYAEVSKSGMGIHLHYIYDGDPKELSHIYDDNIEIKTFGGNGGLRRKLTLCNDLPIAHIGSGLPLKGVKNTVVDMNVVNLEKSLSTTIKKCLAKEVHADTTSNVDFIKKILDDAYASGKPYDVSNMQQAVLNFALNSTNQAERCINTVSKMKWKSETQREETYDTARGPADVNGLPIIFYDVEIFPNVFIVCFKLHGIDGVTKLINPAPQDLDYIITSGRLVGFNNRQYDNHMIYARWARGYSNEELFKLSQSIIGSRKGETLNNKFAEAYNISYTDVLDFSAEKKSLKKFEIDLGINHVENVHPWDQPLEECYWNEVADYCANDVIATEALFENKKQDFTAREILADLAKTFTGKGTVNDTTNKLTTLIILRGDKEAYKQFNYPDLSKEFPGYEFSPYGIDKEKYNPGTKIVNGKSFFMGEDPGEGGYVWAKPGMYWNATTFDVASMHPHTLIAENGFGKYTENFKQLVDIRIYIKHKEYDKVKTMFNGVLAKYLTASDPEELKKQAKALSYALKIAINAVYGQTSAGYQNDLRDPRNIDNWVAKRGALMMIKLRNDVIGLGGNVIHCKTDSIKVEDPSEEVTNYILEFGKSYGYTFEIEAKYDRICLVNESTYIAKESDWEGNEEPGQWTGTGGQFKKKTSPYVFKSLFSKEQIIFDDVCETKSVDRSLGMYLDFNEDLQKDDHNYKFVGKVGRFCPMLPGVHAAELMKLDADGKYSYVTGTKGWRWMESETVKELGLEDKVNKDYYRKQCDEAIEDISKYGDFEMFVNGPSKLPFPLEEFMNIPEGVGEEGIPFN